MMSSQFSSAVNTPAHKQALEIEQTRGDEWVKRMEALSRGRLDVANVQARSKKDVADTYAAAKIKVAQMAKDNPKGTDQRIATLSSLKSSGEITDAQAAELTALLEYKLSTIGSKAANSPPQPDVNAMPPGMFQPPKPVEVPKYFQSTPQPSPGPTRSEEHTSELQSQ